MAKDLRKPKAKKMDPSHSGEKLKNRKKLNRTLQHTPQLSDNNSRKLNTDREKADALGETHSEKYTHHIDQHK